MAKNILAHEESANVEQTEAMAHCERVLNKLIVDAMAHCKTDILPYVDPASRNNVVQAMAHCEQTMREAVAEQLALVTRDMAHCEPVEAVAT
jgi:hypothetical protein